MKWVKGSDYFSVISKIIIIYILELILVDNLFIRIYLFILNILFAVLTLLLINKKYENRLKRKAKEQKFIDDEYERLNKNV